MIDDIMSGHMNVEVTNEKEAASANVPESFRDALRMAADLEDEKMRLAEEKAVLEQKNQEKQQQIVEMAPKVEAYNTRVDRGGFYTATQVGKMLSPPISVRALNKCLKMLGWVYTKDKSGDYTRKFTARTQTPILGQKPRPPPLLRCMGWWTWSLCA
ncbi:phage antirepressor KilAC domain-containing protein [Magnetococcus sp. PR-3]|uniref:phage antirepressor KilAC domain-containing protein n=1 Tax=Magnetococcus sp. PR-3 TaxID=3120355 RepID=UPI002FCE0EE4